MTFILPCRCGVLPIIVSPSLTRLNCFLLLGVACSQRPPTDPAADQWQGGRLHAGRHRWVRIRSLLDDDDDDDGGGDGVGDDDEHTRVHIRMCALIGSRITAHMLADTRKKAHVVGQQATSYHSPPLYKSSKPVNNQTTTPIRLLNP